jgi:hypothetical protein
VIPAGTSSQHPASMRESMVEVRPRDEQSGQFFVFLTSPTSAERLGWSVSRELESALGSFFQQRSSQSLVLHLLAGSRGIAVTTNSPVSDPDLIVALVHSGLAAFDCLTGWTPAAECIRNPGPPPLPIGVSPVKLQ